MTTPNEGTPPVEGQAPPVDPPTGAPAAGTDPLTEEVTTLRSRNRGLDAKITELTKSETEAKQAAAAAAARLADYEAGKVGADEALRAQLAAKDAELSAARREATLAKIEAKFPESFRVLGEDAAGLSEAKLADMETRLKGESSEGEPPTPRGVTGPKGPAAPVKEETADDIEKRFRAMENPWGKIE